MKQTRLNLLFVCSRNQWRSPTAEAIYRNDPRLNVRSCGTKRAARRTVTLQDLDWADVVMVMEDSHRKRLISDFADAFPSVPIHVLDIPDVYHFMDPELVELLRTAIDPILKETWAAE